MASHQFSSLDPVEYLNSDPSQLETIDVSTTPSNSTKLKNPDTKISSETLANQLKAGLDASKTLENQPKSALHPASQISQALHSLAPSIHSLPLSRSNSPLPIDLTQSTSNEASPPARPTAPTAQANSVHYQQHENYDMSRPYVNVNQTYLQRQAAQRQARKLQMQMPFVGAEQSLLNQRLVQEQMAYINQIHLNRKLLASRNAAIQAQSHLLPNTSLFQTGKSGFVKIVTAKTSQKFQKFDESSPDNSSKSGQLDIKSSCPSWSSLDPDPLAVDQTQVSSNPKTDQVSSAVPLIKSGKFTQNLGKLENVPDSEICFSNFYLDLLQQHQALQLQQQQPLASGVNLNKVAGAKRPATQAFQLKSNPTITNQTQADMQKMLNEVIAQNASAALDATETNSSSGSQNPQLEKLIQIIKSQEQKINQLAISKKILNDNVAAQKSYIEKQDVFSKEYKSLLAAQQADNKILREKISELESVETAKKDLEKKYVDACNGNLKLTNDVDKIRLDNQGLRLEVNRLRDENVELVWVFIWLP